MRYLLFCLLLLMACSPEKKSSGKPKVVTTTMMIYDAAKNLLGDNVDLNYIMGPGVDPHVYKATQGDLQKLNTADLIIYNGLHLEGKMGDILERLGRTRETMAMGDFLSKDKLKNAADGTNYYDPHIWFDVSLWKSAVDGLSQQLIRTYPEWEKSITANAIGYLKQLDSLHAWTLAKVQNIPEDQRVLITAHDAFSYYGDAYHIEVRGLQGISTQAEYGLKDVTDMVDFIVARKIKAVFVEASLSERSINAVVEGCRSKGHPLIIGGTLFTDSMGAPGSRGDTYIDMVRFNTETIVNALL